MLREGQVLGDRFEIRGELGRGGTAVVYLARDKVLGNDVALKVLHGHLRSDSIMRDRLSREVQACRRLIHPNILPVYEVHEAEGQLFLAMAHHPGMTLQEWLSEKGPMSVEQVRSFGADIASALEFAHLHGVLHRDLKPQNLLLDEEGHPQLTDFGFARLMDLTSMTASTQVLGTPGYVAPEIYAGDRWEPRSDLYGLGAVLYEALTGKPPFSGANPLGVLQAQVAGQPPAPSSLRPDVPPWLDALVLSLLEVDPEDRPGGAGAVRDALKNAVVPPRSEVPSTPRVSRRAPSPVAAPAAEAPRAPLNLADPVSVAAPEPAPAAEAPAAAPSAPIAPHHSPEEERAYEWLRDRFERVREAYDEHREEMPPALRRLGLLLEERRFDAVARPLAETWAELSRAQEELRTEGIGRVKADLQEMTAREEPPHPTWLYTVRVDGAELPRGRRGRGARFRRRLTPGEARLLKEALEREGLWEPNREQALLDAAVSREPVLLASGLTVDAARRLQARLRGDGFRVRLESPRYKGTRLQFRHVAPALALAVLAILTPVPFALSIVALVIGLGVMATRPQAPALVTPAGLIVGGGQEAAASAPVNDLSAEKARHRSAMREIEQTWRDAEETWGVASTTFEAEGWDHDKWQAALKVYLQAARDYEAAAEAEASRHRKATRALRRGSRRREEAQAPEVDRARRAAEAEVEAAASASAAVAPPPAAPVAAPAAPPADAVVAPPVPGAAEASAGAVEWPSQWPTRPSLGEGSRLLKVAQRNLVRLGQVEGRLGGGTLPDAAVTDLRAQLSTIRRRSEALLQRALGLERAVAEIDEAALVRAVSVLEQRRRRALARGHEVDASVEAGLVHQRELLERMRGLDGELARHMARMLSLSSTLDMLALVLKKVDDASDVEAMAEVVEAVDRLKEESQAMEALLYAKVEGVASAATAAGVSAPAEASAAVVAPAAVAGDEARQQARRQDALRAREGG